MFANSVERRRFRGKGPAMNSRPLPRRTGLKVLNLDASSSEDSLIASTPALDDTANDKVLAPNPETLPKQKKLIRRDRKRPPIPLDTLLKTRELGRSSRRSGRKTIQSQIQDQVNDNPLTPKASWVGASGDVLIAAWSPDGNHYAFGCSTDLDARSAQYNRRNNLLHGDFESTRLRELPDHFVNRKAALAGAAISTSLDPELYTTVTSINFDPTGDYLYTASYDKTVKVWDVRQEVPRVINTLQHDEAVTHLVSSSVYSGSFVTAQSSKMNSIRLYTDHALNNNAMFLESGRAQTCKEDIYPSAVQLGSGPMSQYLLAGFASNSLDPDAEDKLGDICLWDLTKFKSIAIRGNGQNVFDLSWHSNSRLFAAAMKPSHQNYVNDRFGSRSLIRLWQPLEKPSVIQEYACPAVDINEVQFHPRDENYIVASCTDGASYVWDYRMHHDILHKLQHDEPIDEMRSNVAREYQDTGVRLAVWSQDGKRLLTGASDGTIKSWNILAAPEDAFKGDVAQFDSSVMCGSWSPNHEKLLVGLAQGAMEILTADTPDEEDDNDDIEGLAQNTHIDFIPAEIPKTHIACEEEDSGIAASRALLTSQQLVMHPIYGAGKGPGYAGPYAQYAHALDPYGNYDPDKLLPHIGIIQLDEQTRKQARRDGGVRVKRAVSKYDIRIYRSAQVLARARNVDVLGQLVRERMGVFLGKRDRDGGQEVEDHSRGRGKDRSRGGGGTVEEVTQMFEGDFIDVGKRNEKLKEGGKKLGGTKESEDRINRVAAESSRSHADLEELLDEDYWFY